MIKALLTFDLTFFTLRAFVVKRLLILKDIKQPRSRCAARRTRRKYK